MIKTIALGVFLWVFAGVVSAALLENREAVIPPQCYTKTGGHFNPCYVCHQSHPAGTRNNVMNDGGLQAAYAFSEMGETNRWHNLFADKSKTKANISAKAVQDYIRYDNSTALYNTQSQQGVYALDLKALAYPKQAFGRYGIARDGSGWVAYNYKPFPSTFWPTNGSFGDAMIRLPAAFRAEGDAVYLLNLSLLEMTIKAIPEIAIPAFDENLVGVDLDGDGSIGMATRLRARSHYVGGASTVAVLPLQYPQGTEFLHTVRYLKFNEHDELEASPRLKELRYAVKYKTLNDAERRFTYNLEHREKALENLPRYSWAKPAGKAGLNNKMGWHIQGWIEDASGELRPQTYEEHFYCMGCHTSVGTTIDSTFSFPRKVTGYDGWRYINLKGMPDAPNYGEDQGEVLTYLQRVGGGDEFRQNQEMLRRWFDKNGRPKTDAIKQADIYELITPSPKRAEALNRAYMVLVAEQSFKYGREVVLNPATHVYEQIDPETAPVLPATRQFKYDLRLQW